MPTSQSYQLPDLLALIHDFELHANRYCRTVTLASENWFLNNAKNHEDLHEIEKQALCGTKTGLLAALCCPTSDASQLRLVTDFLTMFIFSNSRTTRTTTLNGLSEWAEGRGGSRNDDLRLLIADHRFFRHITPRILQLAGYAHPSWLSRFDRSTRAFYAAQIQLGNNRAQEIVPDLETYVELRRNLSGLQMLFDLVELAEGLSLPDEVVNESVLKNLTHHATDIIAWSIDIVSYHLEHSRGNKHNLVAVLIVERGFSVQSAVNFAASLIKQSIEAFITTERSLSDLFLNLPGHSYSSAWASSSPSFSPRNQERERDIRLYVQGLRDCIAGFINWMYETDLFFGDRGGEVRSFGWIFLTADTDKIRDA